jgi:hypothetical protein
MEPSEAASELGLRHHNMSFSTLRSVPTQLYSQYDRLLEIIQESLNKYEFICYTNNLEILRESSTMTKTLCK